MIEKFYTIKIPGGYIKCFSLCTYTPWTGRVLFFSHVLLDGAHLVSPFKYYSQKL